MRALTYLVAVTADGFIADKDGGSDFFPMTGEHLQYLAQEYPETFPQHLRASFAATGPNRHFNTVVMGRRTYEVGTTLGLTNPYPQLRQFVLSRSMPRSPDPAVQVVCGDPVELLRSLKQEQVLASGCAAEPNWQARSSRRSTSSFSRSTRCSLALASRSCGVWAMRAASN